MTASGLAGTAYAYRPCGRCGHPWIRHTFAPVPACSHMAYAGAAQPGGSGTPGYVKCSCPGWQETTTTTAGEKDTMTTPPEGDGQAVHDAAAATASTAAEVAESAALVARRGLPASALVLYDHVLRYLEAATDLVHRCRAELHHRAAAAPAGKDET